MESALYVERANGRERVYGKDAALPLAVCLVKDCYRGTSLHWGMCEPHYALFKQLDRACTVQGCLDDRFVKTAEGALCAFHYQRFHRGWRGAELAAPRDPRGRPAGRPHLAKRKR